MGTLRVALLFSVYVTLSSGVSLDAGFLGGFGLGSSFGSHGSGSCTTELDDVWEERCETVYEDKCSVDVR